MVTQHHTLETTAVFPHLRAAEPPLAPVIDRLDAEHRVIHGVLETVDTALVAHLGQAAEIHDFTAVDAALDLLTDALLSHLSYEERELLGPLSRHGMFPGQV